MIIIDTGASVDPLDEHTYCDFKSKPKLMISYSKIHSYGGNKPINIFTCDRWFPDPLTIMLRYDLTSMFSL